LHHATTYHGCLSLHDASEIGGRRAEVDRWNADFC
jgi:hypothetical protein